MVLRTGMWVATAELGDRHESKAPLLPEPAVHKFPAEEEYSIALANRTKGILAAG